MRRTILLFSAATVAVAIGCYTGNGVDTEANPKQPTASKEPTEPDGDDDKGGSKVAPEASGLPCDVASILTTSCTHCHGNPVRNGAPNSLVSYDDLASESDDEPGKTIAALALDRMKATQGTMPPSGPLPGAQIAVFEKWVESGMPRGSCGEPSDAGVSDAATDSGKPVDAAAPTVCTSAKYWEAGTPPDETMHPGKRCIACHSATGGPSFQFAGTVFKTLHEPDDCNGLSKNVSILLIDAEGVSHTVAVNAAGNFRRVSAMPMPYRAMVVSGSNIHEMKTPQTDGDCNGCHTEQGKNGAPGRITAP